jgi:tRNA threonylcarbamoyladenosine biosynthesis protein TsaE
MNTSAEIACLTRSPLETQAVAAALVESVKGPTTLALHGDLGSGKTCFVQGLARAIGIDRPVTSPTFIIVNEYKAERPLIHVDLYRLESTREVESLALDEYTEAGGICAVEWAERAGDLLPADAVHVHLANTDRPGERRIRVCFAPASQESAERFRKRLPAAVGKRSEPHG